MVTIIQTEKKLIKIFTQELGNGIKLELVQIPSGTFTMGAPASEKSSREYERPQHNVTLDSFLMGRYPITQGQWREIANRQDLRATRDLTPDPSEFKNDYNGRERWDRPVEKVSWYDAQEFCQRLKNLTHQDYGLPNEAQWEYACRGETKPLNLERGEYYPPFHFGETITSELANYKGTETYADEPQGIYRRQTTPVGMFSPNTFGLYDLHGNVSEWCADDWHDNYDGAPSDGRPWLDNKQSSLLVMRGGAWDFQPINCRSANCIITYRRDDYYSYVGFRVSCVVGRTL